MTDRLLNISSKVDTNIPEAKIIELLSSKHNDSKLLGLLTIRKKVEDSWLPHWPYFQNAVQFLNSKDNNCKWQSFIIIGSFMETKPEECWKIIIEFGNSNDDDTRTAVATILLEHFFEINPQLFDTKFRELRKRINAGSKNLFYTLQSCWSSWGGDTNKNNVTRFIKNYK